MNPREAWCEASTRLTRAVQDAMESLGRELSTRLREPLEQRFAELKRLQSGENPNASLASISHAHSKIEYREAPSLKSERESEWLPHSSTPTGVLILERESGESKGHEATGSGEALYPQAVAAKDYRSTGAVPGKPAAPKTPGAAPASPSRTQHRGRHNTLPLTPGKKHQVSESQDDAEEMTESLEDGDDGTEELAVPRLPGGQRAVRLRAWREEDGSAPLPAEVSPGAPRDSTAASVEEQGSRAAIFRTEKAAGEKGSEGNWPGSHEYSEEEMTPRSRGVLPDALAATVAAAKSVAATVMSPRDASRPGKLPPINTGARDGNQLEEGQATHGAVTREELGRATWTLLHALAAQYPEKPSRKLQRDVKQFMNLLPSVYPCKICGEHFKEVIRSNPPQVGSREELEQYMCRIHNVVNRSLNKPQFPCKRVAQRWGSIECDDDACKM